MKIATWNVNGIRARGEQFRQWLENERPDVVCLQELKARQEQIPESICNLEGYACYWHGAAAYSGVGLHIRRDAFPEAPQFSHPAFDLETRIVQARVGGAVFASVYVPNGGKDFTAKMEFTRPLCAQRVSSSFSVATSTSPAPRGTFIRRSASHGRSGSCRRSGNCSKN
jgi:exodeoxyribonuclease-3